MERYALCIGNNDYKYATLGKLSCAINDANAIGEKLEELGFKVDILLNLNYLELCSAIVGITDPII